MNLKYESNHVTNKKKPDEEKLTIRRKFGSNKRTGAKSNTKKLLIVLGIITVGGGAWLWYQKQSDLPAITEETTDLDSGEAASTPPVQTSVPQLQQVSVPVGAGGAVTYTDKSGIAVSPANLTDNGRQLLALNQIPALIQTPDGETYPAADQFINAVYSPDKRHVLLVTHANNSEFAWLYDVRAGDILPVGASIDGVLRAFNWSNDSQKAVLYYQTDQGDLSRDIIVLDDLPQHLTVVENQ